MSNYQGRFVWHELMTTDPAAAKRFYGSVLGWNYQDVPMPGMTYCLLKCAATVVGGLMPMPADMRPGIPPNWTGHIAVLDVDAAAARAGALGGALLEPPRDIPGVGRFAVLADPLGAVFIVFKSSQPPGIPVPAGAIGSIGWHELHSSDWSRAFDFYHAMFGWQKGDAVDMGPMGAYQLFNIGDQASGGMFNSPAAAQWRFWLYYFVAGDIDTAAARVTAGGGRILNPPHPVPGGGWTVQASDPQGAMFALLGTRAGAG